MEYGKNKALEFALWMLEQGYLSISEKGEIWRHAARNSGQWEPVATRRAECITGKGYYRLNLYVEGKRQSIGSHRVIWTYYIGPIPEDKQINHKDLNKANNRLSNLEVMTGRENIQHSYANGRSLPWAYATSWRGKPRLTLEVREEIRTERAKGLPFRALAEKFNLSDTHTRRICATKN